MNADLITPVYAALAALIFIALSVRTLLLRRHFRVGVGHAGEKLLERAIRVHGNFAEYVPLALLLLFFFELTTGRAMMVHILGMLLLVGRLSHAWGVSQVDENYGFRVFGMAMTFTVIGSTALWIVLQQLTKKRAACAALVPLVNWLLTRPLSCAA